MNEHDNISHTLMWRIVLWEYNRNMDETLMEELFIRYFGKCFGSHFYSKWKYYDCSFMKMVGYFGTSTENGQKFCDMVLEQITKYEQRNKRV
ncbi:MAG: hypothetical protein LBT24_00315 [Tannerella sp.]|jgi:hypothetical protein|nr:hypothetical protein [Tannerella sp.]